MTYCGMGTFECPGCGSMYSGDYELCPECAHSHVSYNARHAAIVERTRRCVFREMNRQANFYLWGWR